MKGTIPAEIGLLSKLRAIDFSHNLLTGSIAPHLFETLPFLENFTVSNNNLTGLVPIELLSLNEIKEINLMENLFDSLEEKASREKW